MNYSISTASKQRERRPLVYELHLHVGAHILNGLRQVRRLMSILTHLLLDEFVRLFDTLPQSIGHLTTGGLECGTGKSFWEISYFFMLERYWGMLLLFLCKLTERHDVHHPPAGIDGFRESLHGGAAQVHKGVSAMGFGCVAVCNPQNHAAGFSVSRSD